MPLSLSHALRERAINTLNLDTVLRHVQLPLCVTDPSQPDNPVIYVNDAFVVLTGYSKAEAVGRNCRFLQGEETDRDSIERIKASIREERSASVELVNYRKDGTKFINLLQVGPVLDGDGKVVLYFGSQTDVTRQRMEERESVELANRELVHRLNNIVTVMATIIRMTSAEYSNQQDLIEAIIGRLTAISDGHLRTLGTGNHGQSNPGDLTWQIVAPYALKAQEQLDVTVQCDLLYAQHTTPVCLSLHELAINSVKYGSLGIAGGRVHAQWHEIGDGWVTLIWSETGGPPVKKPDRASGSVLIQRLVQAVGGSLDFDWRADGVVVTLRLPRMR